MRAILHIGIEKTGTSLIQDFIAANPAALREQGVAVLSSVGSPNHRNLVTYALRRDFDDDHIKALGLEAAEDRERWRENFRVNLHRELDELDPAMHSVLISSEHLHSRLVSEAEIACVHELLSGHFAEFRLVVYLRRQDQLAASLGSTYYKSGYTGSFGDLKQHIAQLAAAQHYFAFDRLLQLWADRFGSDSIEVRRYGDFYGGGLLADFRQATGVLEERSDYAEPDSRNSSLSSAALTLLRYFNTEFAEGQTALSPQQLASLRQQLIAVLEARHAGSATLFTAEEARSFYARFERANGVVARTYFGEETLFDKDFSVYPDSQEEPRMDAALLESLMTFLGQALPPPT